MEFSDTQLTRLSDIGVFTPSGLNDIRRIQLQDGLFWAVDDEHAHEVDDAVRVRRSRTGGFIVEVAIADGTQLSARDDIVEEAVGKQRTRYVGTHTSQPMLPYAVVRQLELRDRHKEHRAMVVRTLFDSQGGQEQTEIFPAYVTSHRLTSHDFARHQQTDDQLSAIRSFLRTQADQHLVAYTPNTVPTGDLARKLGDAKLARLMILANIAVADWTHDNSLPILCRAYDPCSSDGVSYASYTAMPADHFGMLPNRSVTVSHFTSPLRRAADLITHLQVGAFIATGRPRFNSLELQDYAERINEPLRLSRVATTTAAPTQQSC